MENEMTSIQILDQISAATTQEEINQLLPQYQAAREHENKTTHLIFTAPMPLVGVKATASRRAVGPALTPSRRIGAGWEL